MRLRYLIPVTTVVVVALALVGMTYVHNRGTTTDATTNTIASPVKWCVNGGDPNGENRNQSFNQAAIATTGSTPLYVTNNEDHCFATQHEAETYAAQHDGVSITAVFARATATP